MKTIAEFSELAHQWAIEVEHAAVELYKSGTDPTETIGLAIKVVESRRNRTFKERAALGAPPGIVLPRLN